jgi:hypothetical protein
VISGGVGDHDDSRLPWWRSGLITFGLEILDEEIVFGPYWVGSRLKPPVKDENAEGRYVVR